MARFCIIRGHLVESARAAGDLAVVATAINNLADLALNPSTRARKLTKSLPFLSQIDPPDRPRLS
jgi:hypothetical protein